MRGSEKREEVRRRKKERGNGKWEKGNGKWEDAGRDPLNGPISAIETRDFLHSCICARPAWAFFKVF
jgi:hypothetical protein